MNRFGSNIYQLTRPDIEPDINLELGIARRQFIEFHLSPHEADNRPEGPAGENIQKH